MLLEKAAPSSDKKSYKASSSALGTGMMMYGSYNVVPFHVVRFPPGAHDKRIIVGDDSNGIDTLGLDLRQSSDVAGQMADGTAWGEGTWAS